MEYQAHAHIEVLKGRTWLHFAAPDMGEGRPDYLLDAVMAGEGLEYLRESTRAMAGEPAAGCHALPADISEVTKACYEHDQKAYGVHNISVLTAEDLPRLQRRMEGIKGYRYSLEGHVFHTSINGGPLSKHKGWDGLRIILWFNNY